MTHLVSLYLFGQLSRSPTATPQNTNDIVQSHLSIGRSKGTLLQYKAPPLFSVSLSFYLLDSRGDTKRIPMTKGQQVHYRFETLCYYHQPYVVSYNVVSDTSNFLGYD